MDFDIHTDMPAEIRTAAINYYKTLLKFGGDEKDAHIKRKIIREASRIGDEYNINTDTELNN